ncbi:DUF6318 family protein [Pseudactinotalea suaedae]|uniref:DUF6318 family protein n=1 Tax=Pseudactinotalea suaedae TaxID=1524924 RepID=UPI0012E298DF|nr:DUF6318 family protein [Pseudactinotalea suaedae]
MALAMSAGLLLSACDGGEGPTEPPTTGTVTSESTTPTEVTTEPSDIPTPPEVEAPTPAPEAAVDDHIGAIWAARYFMDLYTYMRQTGDTTQFEAMSAPECEFCASSIENVVEIHEEGGWVEGGELVFDIDEATANYPTADEPNYVVQFTVTEQPSTIHAGDGTSDARPGASGDVQVGLQYVDERYVVFGVNFG